MNDDKMTPSEIIATSALYGGIYTDEIAQMAAVGFVKSIVINFPDMHSAASWAMTNGIEHRVNIVFHPIHFDEPLSVRYAFEGE